jgi:hypothetical protein
MTKTTPPTLHDVDDVRRFNVETGHHFFDADALRFFRSRIGERLYARRFFVTSERGPDMVRAYTVRLVEPDGSIADVGGFQAYHTHGAAQRAALAVSDPCASVAVLFDPYDEDDDNDDPRRYSWRVYITTRGGDGIPVGLRTTRHDARRLRRWILDGRR